MPRFPRSKFQLSSHAVVVQRPLGGEIRGVQKRVELRRTTI